MNNAEEATKIAINTRFAVLGRALADAARRGADTARIVEELAQRRQQEQESASKLVRFAGLARQIGDAARSGQDTAPLVEQLIALRRAELGSSHTHS